jgi:three-Cys-motif partner protein
MAGKARSVGKAHRFGGSWTDIKLEVLQKYLNAYTTALQNKPTPENPFRKGYIDAFAGTGYRSLREDSRTDELLFPDLAIGDTQQLLDGSARLALKIGRPFDRYVFIDKNAERCAVLEGLRDEFPSLAERIDIRIGDANKEIRDLCRRSWRSHRAVLFLDPYGMQVEWETIEAIAQTRAIDLLLLFPLGIGVNRLLTRSGQIPASWQRRLDLLLGTHEWFEKLYDVAESPQASLFGSKEELVIKRSVEAIGRYFNDRLKTVFAGVVEEPIVLRNSSNCPLYLLCFAAANERGAPIAIRIANDLMKGLR